MNDAPVEVGGKNSAGGNNVDESTAPLKSLISVIVPIYNVEKYVRKCLDSLKNQTMKQIEVICIDDGSTDESGHIADEYKDEEGWPRFKIIHTENRGLSAARNREIEESCADWIMFVDSDDWVEPGFCEIPYKAAKENSADLVIFGTVWERKSNTRRNNNKNPGLPLGIVDEFTAHENGTVAAWNKLYKRKLFESVRYPEGKVYEDIGTTHKLVHKAKKIIFLQELLYHHVSRKNSITKTQTKKNQTDGFVLAAERTEDLVQWGYPRNKLKATMCARAIGLLSVTLPCNDEIYNLARNVVISTKGIPKELSIKQKVALVAWKIDPRVFYLLSHITGRISCLK